MKWFLKLIKKLLLRLPRLLGERIMDDQLDSRTINISTR